MNGMYLNLYSLRMFEDTFSLDAAHTEFRTLLLNKHLIQNQLRCRVNDTLELGNNKKSTDNTGGSIVSECRLEICSERDVRLFHLILNFL